MLQITWCLRTFAWNFTRSPQWVQSTRLPASMGRMTARLPSLVGVGAIGVGAMVRVLDSAMVQLSARSSAEPERSTTRSAFEPAGQAHEAAQVGLVGPLIGQAVHQLLEGRAP